MFTSGRRVTSGWLAVLSAVALGAVLLTTGCPQPEEPSGPPPTGNDGLTGKFVGSARCATCHNNRHTEWAGIARAYRRLEALTGSPIVRLNRAVAEGEAHGAMAGLAAGMKTIFWPEAPMEGPPGAVVVNSAEELRAELF